MVIGHRKGHEVGAQWIWPGWRLAEGDGVAIGVVEPLSIEASAMQLVPADTVTSAHRATGARLGGARHFPALPASEIAAISARESARLAVKSHRYPH